MKLTRIKANAHRWRWSGPDRRQIHLSAAGSRGLDPDQCPPAVGVL